MAYPHQYRLIAEETACVRITDLAQKKALAPHTKAYSTVPVWEGEIRIGYIDCFSHVENDYAFAAFSVKINGKHCEKSIKLIAKRSNLSGNGVRKEAFHYYFVCPRTGKFCRKLYLVDGHFGCKEAFNLLYRYQTISKHTINWIRVFELLDAKKQSIDEIFSSKSKRTYRGKVTKSWVRKLKRNEAIDMELIQAQKAFGDTISGKNRWVEESANGYTVHEITHRLLPLQADPDFSADGSN